MAESRSHTSPTLPIFPFDAIMAPVVLVWDRKGHVRGNKLSRNPRSAPVFFHTFFLGGSKTYLGEPVGQIWEQLWFASYMDKEESLHHSKTLTLLSK